MSRPSDVLAGVFALPLTDSALRVLFIQECLARDWLDHDDVLAEFEAFSADAERVDKARGAFEQAKQLWHRNT
jgi:hypothetical protein